LRLWHKLWLKPYQHTVATFNVENLFDTVNEPGKDDPIPSASAYERQLDKLAEAIHDELREPTLLGVQEAENLTVLQDLAARPEIEAEYDAVLVDGPDARGIDVGLLYQTDRVTVLDYEQRQGCTTMVDGLGPDGNLDVYDPQNDVTCDSDGDGELDGNRLFSRPPLVVHLEMRMACQQQGCDYAQELWVIVNHWKSKSQDTADVKYTLPRRIEQATFVAGLAEEILDTDPRADLIVLGDLNDFLDSDPLAVLTDAGLSDLLLEVPKPERYTYVYNGESEVLDHVLISQDLWREFVSVTPVHINADYPGTYSYVSDTARRSSDHDPAMVRFRIGY
jgi:predicted extracellular nuclease